MRKSCKRWYILSELALVLGGCATPGPLIETCLLNVADIDPMKWGAQCELKAALDPKNPSMKSVDRRLPDMDKYVCAPPDDFKAFLIWAHRR